MISSGVGGLVLLVIIWLCALLNKCSKQLDKSGQASLSKGCKIRRGSVTFLLSYLMHGGKALILCSQIENLDGRGYK